MAGSAEWRSVNSGVGISQKPIEARAAAIRRHPHVAPETKDAGGQVVLVVKRGMPP